MAVETNTWEGGKWGNGDQFKKQGENGIKRRWKEGERVGGTWG